ncbi:MAG TPA: patatin-like phospholipase family protein [Caulobacteraceae bacterium]|nr:patatin-like phospholipase family protein [Caulobacteraceae bacterium]
MTRALILGGGGPVGIAWEAGLIAGLAEAGVDLAAADYICGTSAGSFVGSQLAMGRPIGEMAAAILAEAQRPRADPPPVNGRPAQQAAAPNLALLFQKMQETSSGTRDPKDVRKEIGAFALAAQTVDEATFIRGFGRSLSQDQAESWPTARDYACTAVDAETGEFVVWTAESKVGLAKAVASSCSVPGVFPPITINGRRYIDGGMRSATNADLAEGHDLVVILALRIAAMNAGGPSPLDREIETLKGGGARVEVVYPDEASQTAFGVNLMDTRVRPAACQAGLTQGRALAAAMGGIWG